MSSSARIGLPRAAAASGRSSRSSCDCSASVAVETIDAAPRERRGHEVAEALARAGPGLADERAAARQDVLDALGHDELRRPLAVRRVRAGERPVRRKQPLEHDVSLRGGSRRDPGDD